MIRIVNSDTQWIPEDCGRFFESNPVLPQIHPRLGGIPFKLYHNSSRACRNLMFGDVMDSAILLARNLPG